MANDTLSPDNGVNHNYVEANDTREKLEDDVSELVEKWRKDEGILSVYSTLAYVQIINLLDRQAAITEREWTARWTSHAVTNAELNADLLEIGNQLTDMENQRDELQDKLDEIEQTHMRLPVDADGVPIKPGDKVNCGQYTDYYVLGINDVSWIDLFGSSHEARITRHVQQDTVKSLIKELVEDHTYKTESCTDDLIAEYAERIRKAVEHGA